MAPFYISCTTCKARLKIRDESAVGEIHTCPRCGSMVMITPPRSGSRAPEESGSGEFSSPSAAAAAAPLQMTFEDAVAILDPNAPPPAASQAPPPAPERPVDLWSDTVDAAPQASEAAPSPPPQPVSPNPKRKPAAAHGTALPDTVDAGSSGEFAAPQGVDSAGEFSSEPLLPGDQWIAPQARVWRQWLILGGSAAAGIALAVAVFGYAVMHTNRAKQAAMAKSQTPNPAADVGETSDNEATEESLPGDDPPDAAAPQDTEAAPSEGASGNDADSAAGADEAESPPAPPEPESEEPNPPPPIESPFESEAAPTPVQVASNSDLLDQFGEFLGGGDVAAAAPMPAAEPAEPEPPTGEVSSATSSDDVSEALETPLPRPAPREVDVAARLVDPIAEIEFVSVPLLEFLEFVSDLSTIPISIEPEALAWRKLSPASLVSVRAKETTVEGVLLAALAPLKLAYVVEDGHLLITGAVDRETTLRTIKHPVEDLTGSDPAKLAELGELIQRLAAPESWKTAGGEGTLEAAEGGLSIMQTEAVHFRVIAFCETLRVSRGMPQRTRFDSALFQPLAPQEAAREKLETPVTLNFRHPTRLTDILAAFGKAAGLTILVDWRAAADAGWPPDAKGSVVADGGPLRESLAKLLTPMDLTYRIVDASTIEITTPENLRTRIETWFHPLSDLIDGKPGQSALMERIQAELGEHLAAGRGAIHLDPAGKHLIAALPHPQQDQLAALLGTLRKP